MKIILDMKVQDFGLVLRGIGAVELIKGNFVFCSLKMDITISIKLTSTGKVSVGIRKPK